MLKGIAAVGLVMAQTVPLVDPDGSLVKYAITQGGLFGVCLVLLYYSRKADHEKQEEFKRTSAEKHEHSAAHIQVLTGLVSETRVAMTKASDALSVQATMLADVVQTNRELVGTIKLIEERRTQRS